MTVLKDVRTLVADAIKVKLSLSSKAANLEEPPPTTR